MRTFVPSTAAAKENPRTLAKAESKSTKYKLAYELCQQKQTAKGKLVWPDESANRCGLVKCCKKDYEAMVKWEKKRAEAAKSLKEKLEEEGKLTPEIRASLDRVLNAPRTGVKGAKMTRPSGQSTGPTVTQVSALTQTDELEGSTLGIHPLLIGFAGLLALGGGYFVVRKIRG